HVNIGLRLAVELAQTGHGGGLLIAKCGSGHVEDGSQILWLKVRSQLAQHVDEDESRAGGDAGLGGHGPLPRHGMVGAEDERHRVDQVDAAFRSCRLSGNGNCCFGGGCRFRGAGDGGGLRSFLCGGQVKILTSRGEPCHRPYYKAPEGSVMAIYRHLCSVNNESRADKLDGFLVICEHNEAYLVSSPNHLRRWYEWCGVQVLGGPQ